MQKMKPSGNAGMVATGVLVGAMALFAGKASAGVVPKSGASTFLDNVPGLSLAPRTLVLNDAAKGKGNAALFNTKITGNAGIHGARIMTPDGPLHEVGVAVGSGKVDVGFATDWMKGVTTVIGGITFRYSDAVSANAVIKSGPNGKPTIVLNTNLAIGSNLGTSGRFENSGDGNKFAVGADAIVVGVMPSASVTVSEAGGKTETTVDANVWSPKFGPGGKVRIQAGVNDIGGENAMSVGLRLSL